MLSGDKLTVIGNIKVSEISESGLLGIAVDPEFSENRFVYLYSTHEDGNRVSRFTLRERLEAELILIANIPFSRLPVGGRIQFGPDVTLYIQ